MDWNCIFVKRSNVVRGGTWACNNVLEIRAKCEKANAKSGKKKKMRSKQDLNCWLQDWQIYVFSRFGVSFFFFFFFLIPPNPPNEWINMNQFINKSQYYRYKSLITYTESVTREAQGIMMCFCFCFLNLARALDKETRESAQIKENNDLWKRMAHRQRANLTDTGNSAAFCTKLFS